MNCERVEKLLPLYVEVDLDAPSMEGVRAHLSSCEACAVVEAEFRSSQAMIHNFGVPEFGAEFYEQMRGAVLAEINSRPLQTRPSLFQTFTRSLQFPRTALAASLALLLLCGALSLILYRSMSKSGGALVSLEKSMGDFSPGDLPTESGEQGSADAIGKGGAGVSDVSVPQREFTAGNIVRRKRTQREPARRQREDSLPQSSDESIADILTPERQLEATAGNSSPTQAVARMEIQTSDPSIRIIWLGREQQSKNEK
jgi:hypothetical protein